MTRMTPLLERNERLARDYTPMALGMPTAQLMIVTCLDHRVDPAIFLGLRLGDAPVIRNAGGRVTPAVIDDIAYLAFLAEQLFGGQIAADSLFEVAVIHHTQCGTGFLADPGRMVLSIGYDIRARKVHPACYDMLASEARIATFLAIARGELPNQSWFKLSRDYTLAFGSHVILSWTGTMFEYLMPSLWMRSYPLTLIARNLAAAVDVQRAFARSQGIPWGISESGNAHRNDRGDYGYHAYGIPHMALFWEATAGPVVSPYSTFLALGVDSLEAISNLRYMASMGWVGAYGYYEASDYTTESRNGELVREWMAHHQGMSLLAVANTLCDDIVQQWFHANPLVQSAELILHEPPTSPADLKAMMKDFSNIPVKVGDAA